MASKNVGAKRKNARDAEVPAELEQREAQDRPARHQAESPVDAMHVDAPTWQENKRGHQRRQQP
jgi:hypothetical protein